VAEDARAAVAEFYDVEPDFPADVPFYRKLIPRPDARVLELGCGTGRVLVELAPHCGSIVGVDASQAMLAICRRRLKRAGVAAGEVRLVRADVSSFRGGRGFDLILAPYRVFQNLERDEQIEGFFRVLRASLSREGTFVLDVFNPDRPAAELRRDWCSENERFQWEVERQGRRIVCSELRRRLRDDPLTLYPVLVYRVYRGQRLEREATFEFPMRCHYADELEGLVRRQGFEVVGRWGGYEGEAYGRGPELLLQIRPARAAS
jgi:ubiquinone/menaquinone biosynthesis C-methylase UbiE